MWFLKYGWVNGNTCVWGERERERERESFFFITKPSNVWESHRHIYISFAGSKGVCTYAAKFLKVETPRFLFLAGGIISPYRSVLWFIQFSIALSLQWFNIHPEMLQSRMPWHTVQYSSPVRRIKFTKAEWHFENKPVVVMMNPQRNVENKNALHLIQRPRMTTLPFTTRVQTLNARCRNPPGPHSVKSFVTTLN